MKSPPPQACPVRCGCFPRQRTDMKDTHLHTALSQWSPGAAPPADCLSDRRRPERPHPAPCSSSSKPETAPHSPRRSSCIATLFRRRQVPPERTGSPSKTSKILGLSDLWRRRTGRAPKSIRPQVRFRTSCKCDRARYTLHGSPDNTTLRHAPASRSCRPWWLR